MRTVPWMEAPYAAAVEASVRAHDPAAEATLAEARQELAAVRTLAEQLGDGPPERPVVQW